MTPWPDTIPSPLVRAQVNADPRSETTEMEGGWIRRRRQHVEPRIVWDVEWNLVADQFALFEDFFKDSLANGSLPFALYMLGGFKQMVFADADYFYTRTDNLVNVSASLEQVAPTNWILASGSWDDEGNWDDDEEWNDS